MPFGAVWFRAEFVEWRVPATRQANQAQCGEKFVQRIRPRRLVRPWFGWSGRFEVAGEGLRTGWAQVPRFNPIVHDRADGGSARGGEESDGRCIGCERGLNGERASEQRPTVGVFFFRESGKRSDPPARRHDRRRKGDKLRDGLARLHGGDVTRGARQWRIAKRDQRGGLVGHPLDVGLSTERLEHGTVARASARFDGLDPVVRVIWICGEV